MPLSLLLQDQGKWKLSLDVITAFYKVDFWVEEDPQLH